MKGEMNAMMLERPGQPLMYRKVAIPQPGPGELQLRVIACGVCRTDLHIVDGELTAAKLPLIPGHEVIARITALGVSVTGFCTGDIVGVPWLGYTCGACRYCLAGRENLCEKAKFTGYTLDGGYAEFMVADARFCFLMPAGYQEATAAPLLCAGLIGFRSYRMIRPEATRIGLYGFGAAAHILTQIAKAQGKQLFAFTREGDTAAQLFAIRMGAGWAGGSLDKAPERLDAAIILAPAGELIPKALKDVDKAGQVICGGIHMSDIPSFPYALLWEERSVQSVANLSREDAKAFLQQLALSPVKTQTTTFPLSQANEALRQLRSGQLQGAAVLLINGH
ncbi:zinc-dependent alcohol dehydrogenase family protein [Mucilaginibacter aquariorum]|uniref:Zinc-dependent alcohol dehydrogenase family protein n=1 Tax=Mucilaginibacter aquariorum TaxID=2967225 RepID=A0ABT1T271_9SPHI|nr:zinc-dependent alcohol dehydrogenase family protein [Mucilaginibacter aquariorum]MCQ6958711.1 zinc-dependent alcohol dehydrogenase family protein [Mucilaginibacter aquariorum]